MATTAWRGGGMPPVQPQARQRRRSPSLPLPAKLVWWVGYLLLVVVLWIGRQIMVGRHRHQVAPIWCAAVVAAPWPVPGRGVWAWPAAGWACVALLAALMGARVNRRRQARQALRAARREEAGGPVWRRSLPPQVARRIPSRGPAGPRSPRIVSERERYVIAVGLAAGAGWHLLWPVLPWQWWWALWVAVAAGCAVPWWVHRGPRSVPVAPPTAETLRMMEWQEQVHDHPQAGPLAGSVLAWDQGRQRYGLRVAAGVRAAEVTAAAELACSLLELPRGGMIISIDPDGDARDYLPDFPDRGSADTIRYWDGSGVDREDTSFPVAVTDHGDLIKFRLRQRGVGAVFQLAVAPNRAGKGSLLRLAGIAAATDPLTLQIALDGAGGRGLPYLRGGCRVYARTPAEWRWVMERVRDLMTARQARCDDLGWDKWRPGPGEPQVWLTIDELPEITSGAGMDKACAKTCVAVLEQISRKGAGLGISGIIATQRNSEPQWGSTTTRGNWQRQGQVALYATSDTQMTQAAIQQHMIRLDDLPAAKGWAKIVDGLDDMSITRARILWIPHREDVEWDGHEAPYGTVEDHLAATVHPDLRPEQATALGLDHWDAYCRGEVALYPAAEAAATRSPVTQPETAERPLYAVPPPLEKDRPAPAWLRALRVLAEGQPLRTSEITERAEMSSPRYARSILGDLIEDGHAARCGDGSDTTYAITSAGVAVLAERQERQESA